MPLAVRKGKGGERREKRREKQHQLRLMKKRGGGRDRQSKKRGEGGECSFCVKEKEGKRGNISINSLEEAQIEVAPAGKGGDYTTAVYR